MNRIIIGIASSITIIPIIIIITITIIIIIIITITIITIITIITWYSTTPVLSPCWGPGSPSLVSG